MSLLEKLRKNSTLKDSAILSESKFFNKKDQISTSVPIINMALSGDIDGGLIPGLTTLAGPSRHFKTTFGLIMVQAYMKRYPESVLLFYDSEFGSPASYFAAFDIDTDRVIHIPIKNIEELKFDLVNQLENIEREDKVFVFVDSIGNLASRKEINDALDQKSVADMTRAKQLKSLFRIITPYLTINDIPMIIVNHTYSCGTEQMLVTTPDGAVSLKDIRKGDTVLTTNGFEEVQYTVEYEDAYVTDIELENGEVLSFTSTHQFKVNGEWVLVADLMPGMELDLNNAKIKKLEVIPNED